MGLSEDWHRVFGILHLGFWFLMSSMTQYMASAPIAPKAMAVQILSNPSVLPWQSVIYHLQGQGMKMNLPVTTNLATS